MTNSDTDRPDADDASPLVPRHVRNLNSMAERAGLTVSVSVEPYEDDPELRLWSKWEGTRARLLSLGLLKPSQHLPIARRQLTIPSCERPWHNPLLTGEVTVTGEQIEWWVDCGPAAFTITERDGVEVITYADEIRYHGSVEALLAAGLCTRRQLPLGKHEQATSGSNAGSPQFEWKSRRQPDGLFVMRIESESARARRLKQHREFEAQWRRSSLPAQAVIKPRPSHLRLVVDNDVPS